ncbi:MAG TPA: DUF1778 domain-containing protein [Bryobacteraceae bacterium]|nr:DUF1778 domain-containing protein [Bryobacteraceae bacterium]
MPLLEIRLSREAKATLEAAAHAFQCSVREFVMESALARAGAVLADRRIFGLNVTRWKAFVATLDAPPRPLPRLRRLFHEPGFFDAES